MFYEVWYQPQVGPLTVQERGPNGQLSTLDKDEAIRWAKDKTRRWPHMDFLVRAEDDKGQAEIVYHTRDDAELQEATKFWSDGTAVSKPRYGGHSQAESGGLSGDQGEA